MRQIELKSDREKKKKRNQIIVSIVLVFIMFFSVLGYSFQSQENSKDKKINYNGFEFNNQNGYWVLKDSSFVFKYNPLQIEESNSELKKLDNYLNKPLYIFSENQEAELEIYTNLRSVVQRIQYACLGNETCSENLPVKTCDDNFVIIKEAEKNEILQEENCVFINGDYENLTQLTDEFLFKIIGIRE